MIRPIPLGRPGWLTAPMRDGIRYNAKGEPFDGSSVNAALTVKARSAGAPGQSPRRPYSRDTEPPELSGMVARVLRSLIRRARDGDLAGLEEIEVIRQAAEIAAIDAAQALRSGEQPYSWTEIGQALGVTRQAAQQRFSGHE